MKKGDIFLSYDFDYMLIVREDEKSGLKINVDVYFTNPSWIQVTRKYINKHYFKLGTL